jgi:putative sigma-54 modulation protein
MRIKIVGRNMNVSGALERQIEKKLRKLDKFFSEDVLATVRLSTERNLQTIEVTIACDGMIIRGEESTQDMYASLDLVVDKLVRQLRRHKTKLSKRLREDAFLFEDAGEVSIDDADEAEQATQVYRVKRFPVKPQDVEEAILQMQLLGHDFYVFSNAATNEVNVLYRRKDGRYGLIEPDYD